MECGGEKGPKEKSQGGQEEIKKGQVGTPWEKGTQRGHYVGKGLGDVVQHREKTIKITRFF